MTWLWYIPPLVVFIWLGVCLWQDYDQYDLTKYEKYTNTAVPLHTQDWDNRYGDWDCFSVKAEYEKRLLERMEAASVPPMTNILNPTTAQIIEHVEKGGTVERWSPAFGWRPYVSMADYWRNIEFAVQHGLRLAPLPDVTVALPRDVAEEFVRGGLTGSRYQIYEAVLDSVREAL